MATGEASRTRRVRSKMNQIGREVWNLRQLCDELVVGNFYTSVAGTLQRVCGGMVLHLIARVHDAARTSTTGDMNGERRASVVNLTKQLQLSEASNRAQLASSYLACERWTVLTEGRTVVRLQKTACKLLRSDALHALKTYNSNLKRVDDAYRRKVVGVCACMLHFYKLLLESVHDELLSQMPNVASMVADALTVRGLDPLEHDALQRAQYVLTHGTFVCASQVENTCSDGRRGLRMQVRALRLAFWPSANVSNEQLVETACHELCTPRQISLRGINDLNHTFKGVKHCRFPGVKIVDDDASQLALTNSSAGHTASAAGSSEQHQAKRSIDQVSGETPVAKVAKRAVNRWGDDLKAMLDDAGAANHLDRLSTAEYTPATLAKAINTGGAEQVYQALCNLPLPEGAADKIINIFLDDDDE